MSRRRINQYLRRERLSAGLSQPELGALLGVSEDVVGNVEREVSNPTLAFVIGCTLLFGKSAAELFPALYNSIQEDLGANGGALDETLRDKTDKRSLKKLALLSAMANRTITFPGL
jgi:transcriptional regulator with XRE-family HTH domain